MPSIALLCLLALLVPASALAELTSRDLCGVSDPCDQHFLEWRAVPADPWIIVGPPLPLSQVNHEQVNGSFRGVVWTGFTQYGEFQAKALRDRISSGPSNVVDRGPELPPDPVTAPQLLSALSDLDAAKAVGWWLDTEEEELE